MPTQKKIITLSLILFGLPLSGCVSMKQVGQKSISMVRNTSSAAASKWSSLSVASLLPGATRIKVVKPREKDFIDLPTGHERALAYQNSQKRRSWFFDGPLDFIEPTLPDIGGNLDGSLLPPKIQ